MRPIDALGFILLTKSLELGFSQLCSFGQLLLVVVVTIRCWLSEGLQSAGCHPCMCKRALPTRIEHRAL